jgi:molecular chaperone DnaK
MLKDTGDKLAAGDRQAVESAMEAVKKAGEGSDAAAIERALEQLNSAQHKAAEALYRQQGQPGGPEEGGGGAAPDGSNGSGGASGGAPKSDVIDAEVVDEGK